MWFVKVEFWDEFEALVASLEREPVLANMISVVKGAERFCKQGKGVSFYSRREISKKVLLEMQKYLNDVSYRQYNLPENLKAAIEKELGL